MKIKIDKKRIVLVNNKNFFFCLIANVLLNCFFSTKKKLKINKEMFLG